jgi:hypothetical protein
MWEKDMSEFSLEFLNPNELIDYHLNAKQHPQKQIDALAKQIQEVGFRQPIIVDKDNVICAGHGRKKAAIQLGLEVVPVHRLPESVSPEKIRAMRLFDNKIQETGWDSHLLNMELTELGQIEGFDFSLTGFDSLPQAFEPDLPDEDEEPSMKEAKLELRISFETEDEQQALFVELRDRGFEVKV